VILDGSGSSDPNQDPLLYIWTGPFGTAAGPTPIVFLTLGTHTITLTVDDGNGETDTDTVQITVEDQTPPTIEDFTANPGRLWPPNHKMVSVSLAADISDNCDQAPVCRIVSVTSNEPVDGLGDGDCPQ